MTFAESISVALSLASIIVGITLGGLAIWLSLYLFNRTKESEGNTSNLLVRMESEIGQLRTINETLSGKLLSTVTSIARTKATTPSSHSPIGDALALIDALRVRVVMSGEPDNTTGELYGISNHNLPGIANPYTEVHLHGDYINFYGNQMMLSGLANYYAQLSLPAREAFDSGNAFHMETADLINSTCNVYFFARNRLLDLEKSRPEVVGYPQYTNIINFDNRWRHLIRNTDQIYNPTEQDSDPSTPTD